MRDLQEIDLGEAAADELGIDALLDVAGEEEPVLADLAQEDDGHVVDRRAAVGRPLRHAVRVRPEDPEADPVEAQPVAGRQPAMWRAAGGQRRRPRSIAGTRPNHARLVHATDPVPREQRRQARHVVFVRVGQHQDVDASVPGRQSLIEGDEEASRIGPTIDEEPPAAATLDQDSIALTDIEDNHAHEPVWVMRQRDGQPHGGRGERDRRHARASGVAGRSLAPARDGTNARAAA
jgi:hypothetical protein